MTTLARALPSLIPSPRKPYNSNFPGFPHLNRSTAALHSLLAYTADPRVPVLLWDMRFSPSAETLHMSSATSTASPVPVPLILLHSSATDPPQREMRIHCVGHDIWQPLVVSTHVERTSDSVGSRSPKSVPPASARNTPDTPEYVTVLHVLRAMHSYLQKGVSGAEYEAFGALPTPGLQTAVARAFHERSSETEDSRIIPRRLALEGRARSYHSPSSHQGSTSPTIFGAVIDAESVVRKSGLQRLDCLLGQSRFLGLCHVENEPNVYYIRVDSSR
ncbi:hypothetical protein DFH11DRAFT_1501891 [Phellopilus nigrolimitatus]|nr:hypothetical protein DFH11DRAFT_1501891 [Phellopilus nigrolimitatus]